MGLVMSTMDIERSITEHMRLVDQFAVETIHAALAAHTGKATEASPGVAKEAGEASFRRVLTAAIAAEREDAARYRWLRDEYMTLMCSHIGMAPKVKFMTQLKNPDFTPAMLDAAIDARLAGIDISPR